MLTKTPAAILALIVLATPAAWSHPLGNYSINQYFLADLRVSPPDIYYLLDMAEIPSFTELDLLDTDFDSEVTDEETEKYLNLKVPPLLANLALRVNGDAIPLELQNRHMALHAGQGGMVIFNVILQLKPESWPEAEAPFELELESKNHADESGVRECKLILDNHFSDSTKTLPADRLGYQTLVFLDTNANPVYQDFDSQFIVRLAESGDEPISGEAATQIAFAWTATAKGAVETGEEKLVAAMSETLNQPAAPRASSPESEAKPELVAVEPSIGVEADPPEPPTADASTPSWMLTAGVGLVALIAGIWLGRISVQPHR